MSKVLRVTKPDKTVHIVPIENENFYHHLNNNVLRQGEQWKLDKIDAKDVKNQPFIDETFISGTEAQSKVSTYQSHIQKLEAELAALKSAGNATVKPEQMATDPAQQGTMLNQLGAGKMKEANDGILPALKDETVPQAPSKEYTATELIALIMAADTAEEVDKLFKNDERVTVQNAVAKRMAQLEASK